MFVSGNGGIYSCYTNTVANGFLVHRPCGDVEFVIRKAICQDHVRTILQHVVDWLSSVSMPQQSCDMSVL